MGVTELLVEAAIQAPTGDNCQPWVFTPRPGGLDFSFDREIAASVFNVRDVPTLLSFGAALENISLKAGELGLRLSSELVDASVPVLRLSFEEDARVPRSPLAGQIFLRQTNRLPYRRRRIDDETLRAIVGSVATPGRVDAVTDARRGKIVRLIARCDRLRWEDEPLIEELFSKVKFHALAKYTSRDGLAYDTMGIGRGALAFFHWLSQGRRAQVLSPLGLNYVMALQSLLLTSASPAVALIRTASFTTSSLIEAGRHMQRFWLRATELGLAVQPLASLPLLCLRSTLGEDAGFSQTHRAVLRELAVEWKRVTDAPDGCPSIMAFRIGYAPPTFRALRRPVGALLPSTTT